MFKDVKLWTWILWIAALLAAILAAGRAHSAPADPVLARVLQLQPHADRAWARALTPWLRRLHAELKEACHQRARERRYRRESFRRCMDIIEPLRAERDKLAEALRWYADLDNYDEENRPGFTYDSGHADDPIGWEPDAGERARAALSTLNK
jgi:hypothetical protein